MHRRQVLRVLGGGATAAAVPVGEPPDAPTHHRGISANTPQPRYSRV
jgi:hypothetical protein